MPMEGGLGRSWKPLTHFMRERKKFLAQSKMVTFTQDDALLPGPPMEGHISHIPSAGVLKEAVFCQCSISCL
jgi:hypothetical protein